jgi:hypothetical protein
MKRGSTVNRRCLADGAIASSTGASGSGSGGE